MDLGLKINLNVVFCEITGLCYFLLSAQKYLRDFYHFFIILFIFNLGYFGAVNIAFSGLLIATLLSALPPLIYQLYVAFTKFQLRLDVKSTLKIYLTSFTSAIPLFVFLQFSPFNGFLNLLFSCALYLFTFLTMVPLTRAITEADLADL